MNDFAKYDGDKVGFGGNKPSSIPTKDVNQTNHRKRGLSEDNTGVICPVRRKLYPPTQKSTPILYQKGKYKNVVQGVRRTLPVHKRGRPPRGRLREKYARNKGSKGEKKWDSEHVWAPLLEPNYSHFFLQILWIIPTLSGYCFGWFGNIPCRKFQYFCTHCR